MTRKLIAEFSPLDFFREEKKAMKLKVQIKKYADKFLKDNYDVEPIKINYRYLHDSRLAFYQYSTDLLGRTDDKKIVINLKTLYYAYFVNIEYLYSVLRHELIHYALQDLGRAFDDGDDDFETELEKHNSISSATTDPSKRKANTAHNNLIIVDVYSNGVFDPIECKHTRKNYNSGTITLKSSGVSVNNIKRTSIRVYC